MSRPACDYRHEGQQPPGDWYLVGESGDYCVCDEHFQMRTEERKRGWTRINDGMWEGWL